MNCFLNLIILGSIPTQETSTSMWSVGWKASWSHGLVDTISRWENGPAYADGQHLFISWCVCMVDLESWWYYLGSILLDSILSFRVGSITTI